MAKPKILLVDDTKLILELEKSFLRSSELEVITADNGAAALELVSQSPPDLIFMDVNMPIMDGITCCRTLKSDPFLCNIPVVMVTTAGTETDRTVAAEAGCDDYLTKPLDRQLFLSKARKYIGSVDRRSPRVPCGFPALVMQGEMPMAAQIIDLAEGGVFIATDFLPLQELPVKIGFFLPSTGSLVETSARVAWVNNGLKKSLPHGFGAEFGALQDSMRTALRHFVQRHKAGAGL